MPRNSAKEPSTNSTELVSSWSAGKKQAALNELADLFATTLDCSLPQDEVHGILSGGDCETWREALLEAELRHFDGVGRPGGGQPWRCKSCGADQVAVDVRKKLRRKVSSSEGNSLLRESALTCTKCGTIN